MSSDAPLLAVTNLTKTFGGVKAVNDVSFSIPAGGIHSLIGPNGAGKTTLFNLVTGLYVPSAGAIGFEGRDITGRAPEKLAAAGISRTFQNLQVCMTMTALENVMLGGHLAVDDSLLRGMVYGGRTKAKDATCRAKAFAVMERLGIDVYAERVASSLPFGILKRLELARAMLARPALLLLDEPAAGLNQTEKKELEAVIRQIAADRVTIVVVEHDMRMVMSMSDHVIVLASGRRIANGTVAEVRANPEVIAAYLGTGAGAAHA